jgi:ABC-type Na+ efflux pump permease subunit
MANAQLSDNSPASMAFAGTMMLVFVVIGIAMYIYVALALQTIATKTATANGWLAWIPIANIFLMLSVAKKPTWWFILFLIPLVNIAVAIMTWMGVAEAVKKPSWWGILMIVPLANLVVPGYLAWAD